MSGWSEPLAGWGRRAKNLRPAHREIGDLLVEMTKQNIETGGGNESWPPLAMSTLLARARNPQGRPTTGGRKILTKKGKINKAAARAISGVRPLIWSGALLRSIRDDAQADYVDVGTPMVKGWALFFGSKRVPARYPFKFRVGDEERIKSIYMRHIFQGLGT